MPIPNSIKKEHILKAIAKIDKEGIDIGRESTRHYLIYNNKPYPPKYVISIASTFVEAENLENIFKGRFSGGNEANSFLQKLGFNIVSKEDFDRKGISNMSEEKIYELDERIKKELLDLYEKMDNEGKIHSKKKLTTYCDNFKNRFGYDVLKNLDGEELRDVGGKALDFSRGMKADKLR